MLRQNNGQVHNVFLQTALILFPSLGHTPVQAFKGKWLAQQPAQRAATLTKQQNRRGKRKKRKKKGEKTPDVIAGESDGSSGFCQVPDGQGLYGKDGDGADFQTCLCPENLYKQSLKKKHQRKFFAFITYRLLISHLTWTTNPLAASQTGPENSSCGMFW